MVFEIVHIGAGDFWVVLDLDSVPDDMAAWCDARGIVLERRTFWYDQKIAALVHADEAPSFWETFRR